MWVVLLLFVCFLLAVGYLFSGNALAFTVKSLVGLGAIAFVVFIAIVVSVLNQSPKTNSSNNQIFSNSQNTSQPDPFPFYDADQQYAWYDRNDVPMSDRCYTTMTTPCSSLEWQQALGVTLTPVQQQTIKAQWCQKFASQWNQTVEQCIASS
jgi:hypothetical protein